MPAELRGIGNWLLFGRPRPAPSPCLPRMTQSEKPAELNSDAMNGYGGMEWGGGGRGGGGGREGSGEGENDMVRKCL